LGFKSSQKFLDMLMLLGYINYLNKTTPSGHIDIHITCSVLYVVVNSCTKFNEFYPLSSYERKFRFFSRLLQRIVDLMLHSCPFLFWTLWIWFCSTGLVSSDLLSKNGGSSANFDGSLATVVPQDADFFFASLIQLQGISLIRFWFLFSDSADLGLLNKHYFYYFISLLMRSILLYLYRC
jgi:hypothetical protein